MCKVITEEHCKLSPSLNEYMRGGPPSMADAVVRRIGRLYDCLPRGGELEITVTREEQTYLQIHDIGGDVLMTEHFNRVFAYGRKGDPGQLALLDAIDSLMGAVTEEEKCQFDKAKDKVKHSDAFCLSLRFRK